MNPGPADKTPRPPAARPLDDDAVLSVERQLALVDRVLGLEAQVAQLSSASVLTPSEQLRAEQELAVLRGSLTWRLGRVASAPVRAAQRVARGRNGG